MPVPLPISPRLVWILLALGSAALALASLILTPWLDLEPCHLCIFQRLLFMLMAVLAASLALWQGPRPRPGSAWFAALPFMLLAALGSGVAAYQSWLQWQPLGSLSCVGGPPGLIERGVEWLGERVPALFMASGLCEETELTIFGLSLANWAFVCFVAALLAALWALWRGPAGPAAR